MIAQTRLAGLRTSRPGHGKIRVDPARMVRYQLRTLSEPPARYVASAREMANADDYHAAILMAREPGPLPAVLAWWWDVEDYCRAKGLRLEFFAEESLTAGGRIFTWEGRPR